MLHSTNSAVVGEAQLKAMALFNQSGSTGGFLLLSTPVAHYENQEVPTWLFLSPQHSLP